VKGILQMKDVSIDPDQILSYKIDRQDVKRIATNYAKWFGFYLVFMFIVFIVLRQEKDTYTFSKIMFILLPMTLVYAGCFIYYGISILMPRKRCKKQIDKYGAQLLTSDLMKLDNDVFYLDANKSETYVIISGSFIYFAHDSIYSLDDISKVYIYPGNTKLKDDNNPLFSSTGMATPYNPFSRDPKEMARFIKKAVIELKNGKTIIRLVALEEDQTKELLNILQGRL